MELIIHTLSNGDFVHKYQKSIVIPFREKRKVLSTSPMNGGYQEELSAVFNHDGNPGAGMACSMRAATYEEHMRLIASEFGLNPDKAAGISTAASMENAAIKVESFEELTVTAIVTGGVEVNGGRVGDPASYHEHNGKTEMLKLGTINIILVIDADLPQGTMARALVTCTEAKSAALQELMAGSNYSSGLATGSGTDGTIIVSNPMSKMILTNAGKHSKLGELIGLAVKEAVKEALYLQTGLCADSQHSILKRMKRYGINEEVLWQFHLMKDAEKALSKPDFIHRLHSIERDNQLVTYTSLFVHVLDQLEWGLLGADEVECSGRLLLEIIKEELNNLPHSNRILANSNPCGCEDTKVVQKKLLDAYATILATGGKSDV